MKIVMALPRILWRGWFYLSVAIAIILLYPFIFITSLRSRSYRYFFVFARLWGKIVLLLSGCPYRVHWHQKPEKGKLYIICANHTSMLDIMLTLAIFRNCFVFIGKKELARMPLFGYFYKRTNILVDRKSLRSNKKAMQKAAEKLDEKIGLCLYPEGGIPDENVNLGKFKQGAFRLAAEKQVPIIPVTFLNNKKRLPYNPLKGGPGLLRAEVHPFLEPEDTGEAEVARLRGACYQLILQPLQSEK